MSVYLHHSDVVVCKETIFLAVKVWNWLTRPRSANSASSVGLSCQLAQSVFATKLAHAQHCSIYLLIPRLFLILQAG